MLPTTGFGQEGVRVAGRVLCCLLIVLFWPADPFFGETRLATLVSDTESNEKARLLFFTATWCAPCKKVEPVLVELAERLDGQLQLVVIDFDESPIEVSDFQVEELPTIILLDSEKNLLIRVDGASKDGMKALMEEVEEQFGLRIGEDTKERR